MPQKFLARRVRRSDDETAPPRNSSFTFKGRSVDVRAVGRDLGVRSVLEGSIRRRADDKSRHIVERVGDDVTPAGWRRRLLPKRIWWR